MVKVPWFRYQNCLVPLPCCFSKDPLKREFLDIYFTTYFRFCSFRNTSGMRSIFFGKYSKLMKLLKMQKQIAEKIFLSGIIASELAI